jgi:L-fucose mutarotase
VLIADGNYPFLTKLGPRARLVNLNLSPGLVDCVQVLQTLVTAIPVEEAAVMQYATSGPYALSSDPEIWGRFRETFEQAGFDEPLKTIERFAFYEAASTPDVALTIATGEQRIYANLLLTIGVMK